MISIILIVGNLLEFDGTQIMGRTMSGSNNLKAKVRSPRSHSPFFYSCAWTRMSSTLRISRALVPPGASRVEPETIITESPRAR